MSFQQLLIKSLHTGDKKLEQHGANHHCNCFGSQKSCSMMLSGLNLEYSLAGVVNNYGIKNSLVVYG